MRQEEKHFYSEKLQKDLYYSVYGHAGKPCLVFPSQNGGHRDFEGFGMVECVRPWIDRGLIRLICVDSVDEESWSAKDQPLARRSARQEAYFQHISDEFAPLVLRDYGDESGKILTTGCSLGGTHAALALFRRPDLFDRVISISACFDARVLFEGQMDETLYFSSPVDFLAGMPADHPYLAQYRASGIVVVIGQGRWEGDLLPGIRRCEELLASKEAGAWFDYWGYDVDHDWPWWRKMLPYHIALQWPIS